MSQPRRLHNAQTVLGRHDRTEAVPLHFIGGANAELVEEHGRPDVVVDRGAANETWAEVKFIHTTTAERGLLRALQKANKQLRSATSGGAGVVYVDLERIHAPRTLLATPEEAEAARLPSGEDPAPADIAPRIAAIETALSGANYKSIGLAVVTWEDHSYIGEWPGPVTYFVRRQSLLRRHHMARSLPLVADDVIRPGGWTAFGLGRDSPGLGNPTPRALPNTPTPLRHHNATQTPVER